MTAGLFDKKTKKKKPVKAVKTVKQKKKQKTKGSFKPGQCGNPNGRPKGESKETKIKKKLQAELKKDFAEGIDVKVIDDLKHLAIEMALDGNEKMMTYILDQYHGKAPQRLEMTGKDGAPLQQGLTDEEKALRDKVLKEHLGDIQPKKPPKKKEPTQKEQIDNLVKTFNGKE